MVKAVKKQLKKYYLPGHAEGFCCFTCASPGIFSGTGTETELLGYLLLLIFGPVTGMVLKDSAIPELKTF
jgi:hypothetical protein